MAIVTKFSKHMPKLWKAQSKRAEMVSGLLKRYSPMAGSVEELMVRLAQKPEDAKLLAKYFRRGGPKDAYRNLLSPSIVGLIDGGRILNPPAQLLKEFRATAEYNAYMRGILAEKPKMVADKLVLGSSEWPWMRSMKVAEKSGDEGYMFGAIDAYKQALRQAWTEEQALKIAESAKKHGPRISVLHALQRAAELAH